VPAAARLTLASCAAALALAGCGGGGGDSPAVDAQGTIASQPALTTEKPGKPNPAKRGTAAAGQRCQADVGGFVASMQALRKRLAVGVTYDQYLDEIHAVRSTYRKIPVQALPIDCLAAAGTLGERAFNRYIEAANDWGECVSQVGCEAAQVEPVLQRKWRIAAHYLDEAGAGLRRVD
jgi:hypothetical protein